jgi:hypothetical protein
MLPNRLCLQLVGKMGTVILPVLDNHCLLGKVFLINGISNVCVNNEEALTVDIRMEQIVCARNVWSKGHSFCVPCRYWWW